MVIGLKGGAGIEGILSEFDRNTQDNLLFQEFVKSFAAGVSAADLPIDFVVEQLSLIPGKYRRLKTRDADTSYPGGNQIFTPSGLVDHLALQHYNGFNLFDLLDDDVGYATLEIDNERFYFVLMRNKPVSSLISEEEIAGFEYRLAIWNENKELVGFRNHYIFEGSNGREREIRGYFRSIQPDFSGKSNELGLDFLAPTNDGVWVNPDYRRRHIGHTLENIASGFIPLEFLGINRVIVHPGGKEVRSFYWAAGYDEDVLISYSGKFPKMELLPKDHRVVSQLLRDSGLGIDGDYSQTWQYTRALNLLQKPV